jgi:hypothetical protein
MIIGELPSNGFKWLGTNQHDGSVPGRASKTYWRSEKLLTVTGIKRTRALEALN